MTNTLNNFDHIKVKNVFVKYILFWILGLINNLGGVVVMSAAKSVSEHFHKEHLFGLLVWSNIGLGLVAKILNATLLLQLPTRYKMTANFFIMFSGLAITAVATKLSFEMAIGGILLIGISSSLGESTLMGFFKYYHPSLVGAWGGGTGAAGLVGTAVYIVMKSVLNWSNFIIFCSLVPLSVVYFIAYVLLSTVYGPKTLAHDYNGQDDQDEPLEGHGNAQLLHVEQPLLTVPQELEYSHTLSTLLPISQSQQHLNLQHKQFSYGSPHSLSHVHNVPITPRHGSTSSRANAKVAVDFNYDDNMVASIPEQSFIPSEDPIAYQQAQLHAAASFNHYQNDDDKFAQSNYGGYGSINTPDAVLLQPRGMPTTNSTDSLTVLKRQEELEKQRLLQEFEEEMELKMTLGAQLRRTWPVVGSAALGLMTIYFLEYVVISLFASHANPNPEGKPWVYRNAYEILSFCYQIGVFFSRSSITCFKFTRTWLLVFLQLINFIVWLIHVKTHFISSVYVQFTMMVWVGIMAGLCYVNTFYLIQTSKLGRDKEFAVNVASVLINVGIMSSSFFTLISDATWLNKA